MAEKGDGVGRQFIMDLRSKPLAPLYIFYGEESYRRETAIGFIKRRLVPDAGALWDFIEFKEKVTAGEIAEAASTPPVMADRKLVLVHGFDPFKNDISPVVDVLGDECCVVFSIADTEWKPDRRTKAYKDLAKTAVIAEFTLAGGEELAGFVGRCFADRGHKISRDDIEYLCFICSPRMGELINEIDKISAHAQQELVRREDIDAVATRVVEARIFEMCDELAAGRYGKALDMIGDLERAGEAAIAVISVIARQFRQLYAARLAQNARRGDDYIMKILSLRYVSIARRISQSASRISLTKLRAALMLCMETDTALKSSRAQPYELIRLFVMRYAALDAQN